MLKVVYFDEGSAMDLISIKNGGNLIEQTIKEKKSGNTSKGEIRAGVSAGKGIRKLLDIFLVDIDGEVKFDGSLFREKAKIIESSLSNTLLTDFIELVNRQRKKEKEVEKLENYKIEVVEDSIAYYQRISPYLILTEGKVDLDQGINININKLHDTLKTGKGYYELLATNYTKGSSKEVIIRFNNSVFRNNYSVSDLDQMELVFYGVKVGRLDKKLLNFQHQMDAYSNNKKDIDVAEELKKGFQPDREDRDENGTNLEVYDIILAGVE